MADLGRARCPSHNKKKLWDGQIWDGQDAHPTTKKIVGWADLGRARCPSHNKKNCGMGILPVLAIFAILSSRDTEPDKSGYSLPQ